MSRNVFRNALATVALAAIPAVALPTAALAQTTREEFPAPAGFTPGYQTVASLNPLVVNFLKK